MVDFSCYFCPSLMFPVRAQGFKKGQGLTSVVQMAEGQKNKKCLFFKQNTALLYISTCPRLLSLPFYVTIAFISRGKNTHNCPKYILTITLI